ncbi:MAG: hypothetical protein MZV64_48695 [Ignavibacteriales bacterium]|nr:hypothetical protein [Ignavibacteriales bacterium]
MLRSASRRRPRCARALPLARRLAPRCRERRLLCSADEPAGTCATSARSRRRRRAAPRQPAPRTFRRRARCTGMSASTLCAPPPCAAERIEARQVVVGDHRVDRAGGERRAHARLRPRPAARRAARGERAVAHQRARAASS